MSMSMKHKLSLNKTHYFSASSMCFLLLRMNWNSTNDEKSKDISGNVLLYMGILQYLSKEPFKLWRKWEVIVMSFWFNPNMVKVYPFEVICFPWNCGPLVVLWTCRFPLFIRKKWVKQQQRTYICICWAVLWLFWQALVLMSWFVCDCSLHLTANIYRCRVRDGSSGRKMSEAFAGRSALWGGVEDTPLALSLMLTDKHLNCPWRNMTEGLKWL